MLDFLYFNSWQIVLNMFWLYFSLILFKKQLLHRTYRAYSNLLIIVINFRLSIRSEYGYFSNQPRIRPDGKIRLASAEFEAPHRAFYRTPPPQHADSLFLSPIHLFPIPLQANCIHVDRHSWLWQYSIAVVRGFNLPATTRIFRCCLRLRLIHRLRKACCDSFWLVGVCCKELIWGQSCWC